MKLLSSSREFDLPVVPSEVRGDSLKPKREACGNGTTFPRYNKFQLEVTPEITERIRSLLENPRLKKAIGKRRIALYGNPEVQGAVSKAPKLVIMFVVKTARFQPRNEEWKIEGFIPTSKKAIKAHVRFKADTGTIEF